MWITESQWYSEIQWKEMECYGDFQMLDISLTEKSFGEKESNEDKRESKQWVVVLATLVRTEWIEKAVNELNATSWIVRKWTNNVQVLGIVIKIKVGNKI